MADVTINLVYDELKKLRREVHEIRSAIIPEEEIGAEERKELHSVVEEMKSGKESEWKPPARK